MMWTLILVIHGCCSAGSSGTAMASVPDFPTEAACVATGEALNAKGAELIYHCAKVARTKGGAK